MMFLRNMTSVVRVRIAAREHRKFFEHIKEAFEGASDSDIRIFVEDFYETLKDSDVLDCVSFIVATEKLVIDYSVEQLDHLFTGHMHRLVSIEPLLNEQTILVLHESEEELLNTLCEMFNLDPATLATDENSPFSFFSLPRNYQKSRVRARWKDLDYAGTPQLYFGEKQEVGAPQIKTSWNAVIVEHDPELADNMATLLVNKAHRQKISISVVPYGNVADALVGIAARKPFVVSINPRLALGAHDVIDQWGGLELLPAAYEHGIPTILRSDCSSRQIQGALAKRRIKVQPHTVVSTSVALAWAEAMLTQLMTAQKH